MNERMSKKICKRKPHQIEHAHGAKTVQQTNELRERGRERKSALWSEHMNSEASWCKDIIQLGSEEVIAWDTVSVLIE